MADTPSDPQECSQTPEAAETRAVLEVGHHTQAEDHLAPAHRPVVSVGDLKDMLVHWEDVRSKEQVKAQARHRCGGTMGCCHGRMAIRCPVDELLREEA